MSLATDMFAKLPLLSMTRGKGVPKFDRGIGLWFELDDLDPALTIAFISLLSIGLIMVASSSISVADRDFSNPFYYLQRQLLFVVMGLVAAITVFKIRLAQWEKSSVALLILALVLLVLVLVPGLGKAVNGSTRWLPLGIINLQVSLQAVTYV